MVATRLPKPKRGDYVTIIRRGCQDRPITGQIAQIEDSASERYYWIRLGGDLAGTVVVPHRRIARMMRHPGPIRPGAAVTT
jgi:hypothetical protein